MRNARSAPAKWNDRVRPGGLRRRLHGEPALPRRRARQTASRPGGDPRPGRQSRRAGLYCAGWVKRGRRASSARTSPTRARRPRPCSATWLLVALPVGEGTPWADRRRIDTAEKANARNGGRRARLDRTWRGCLMQRSRCGGVAIRAKPYRAGVFRKGSFCAALRGLSGHAAVAVIKKARHHHGRLDWFPRARDKSLASHSSRDDGVSTRRVRHVLFSHDAARSSSLLCGLRRAPRRRGSESSSLLRTNWTHW